MLSRLKSLLGNLSAETEAPRRAECARLATAALLVEAAAMDGTVGDAERTSILALLKDRFEMNAAEAEELFVEASATAADSTQLFDFTRTIKDAFDYDQRVRMIEMLWEVAYVDGQLHDYESNLVRRVSGLIFVSDQDSGTARKRALGRLGLSD